MIKSSDILNGVRSDFRALLLITQGRIIDLTHPLGKQDPTNLKNVNVKEGRRDYGLQRSTSNLS